MNDTKLITTLEEALKYCVKHDHGKLEDLKKVIHSDLIKEMALIGLINVDYEQN